MKTNRMQKDDLVFVVINSILFSVLLLGIIISILDKRLSWIDWDDKIYNSVGISSQIITAIVTCVSSIIAISFSLQNETIFGVEVREIYLLRYNRHYSFRGIVIIAICLATLNIAFYLMGLLIASIVSAIVAIVYCIYASVTEIPLMAKEEKALLKVVKDAIHYFYINDKVWLDSLNTIIQTQLTNKNIREVFEDYQDDNCCNHGETTYNQYLILQLLEMEQKIAFSLDIISDKKELAQIISSLIENIKIIAFFNLDISKIFCDTYQSYTFYMTRILFRISETEYGRKKATQTVCSILSRVDYANDDAHRLFDEKIVLAMVSISTNKGDFSYINALREQYSSMFYSIEDKSTSTTVFSVLSMHLYYLCKIASDYPEPLKNELLKIITTSCIVDNVKVHSWASLFSRFQNNFNVEFNDFYNCFLLNDHNWEIEIDNGEMHWVALSESFIMNWYLSNLLNSTRATSFDYSTILIDERMEWEFKSLMDKCFNTKKEFSLTDTMKDALTFFGDSFHNFEVFKILEERDNKLFSLKNELIIKDLNKKASGAKSVSNTELIERFYANVLSAIETEWGYMKSEQFDAESRYIKIYSEKFSRAVNFDECLQRYFINSIINDIRNNTNKTIIERNNDFDAKIIAIGDENIEWATRGAKFNIDYYLKDESTRSYYKQLLQNTKEIESKIFYGDVLIKKDGFSFNFAIDKFVAEDLTTDEINRKVETFRRDDGQYVCEGAFVTRQFLEEYVRQTYVTITLAVKHKEYTYDGSIIEIDLYPNPKANENNEE